MGYEMPRVLANATVDVVREPPPGHKGLTVYSVEVWGRSPHDFVRRYEIHAKSDNYAAQEGIQRFVAEMEALEDT
jgi:hypothetical protein